MPSTPSDDRGCPKCGHTEVATDKISTTGGGLSKMFDIQNRGFQTVTCTNCGFTELYASDAGTSNLVDGSLASLAPRLSVRWLSLRSSHPVDVFLG